MSQTLTSGLAGRLGRSLLVCNNVHDGLSFCLISLDQRSPRLNPAITSDDNGIASLQSSCTRTTSHDRFH